MRSATSLEVIEERGHKSVFGVLKKSKPVLENNSHEDRIL